MVGPIDPGGARGEIIVAPTGEVAEILNQRFADGFDQFDYQVWTDQKAKDNGDDWWIWNNHYDQIRESYQRVILGVDGGPLWQPDKAVAPLEVKPDEMREFLIAQAVKYRPETKDSLAEWEALDGRKIVPFVYPTYYGEPEPLDGQLVRELHIVSAASQRERNILEYIARARANGWSGDRRGSTLNLTVPASLDDVTKIYDGSFDNASVHDAMGAFGGTEWVHASRFTPVAIGQGATVNSCLYILQPVVADGSSPDPQVHFYFEDADNPSRITSNGDYNGRALTAAVDSTIGSWGSLVGVDQNWNLTSPAQTVISRAGFASGNAQQVITHAEVTDSSYRRAASYDYSNSVCGRLAYDYTGGAGGGKAPPPFQRRWRMMGRRRRFY